MQRGEVWWAFVGERCPVVLLSGDADPQLRAMHVVAAATAEEKRGFMLMSGEEAGNAQFVHQVISSAVPGIGGIGIEVEVGTHEGLPHAGVVRVALPRGGHIFCTWLVTVTPESLIERAGALSGPRFDQLTNALRLAGIE